MECKIYDACPYAMTCAIVRESEFCAYHQQHAPTEELNTKLDFIPEEGE